MAKSTCSSASSCSYSSSQSASTSSSKSSPASSTSSSSQLGFKSVTDRRKRLAANARERKRMHLLNQAYDRLRKRLVDAENKSKYDVLVQAKEYIQALAAICEKMDTGPKDQELASPSPAAIGSPADTIISINVDSPGILTAPSAAAAVSPLNTSTIINPIPYHTTTSQYHHPQQLQQQQFEQLDHHHYSHTIARFDQTLDYV